MSLPFSLGLKGVLIIVAVLAGAGFLAKIRHDGRQSAFQQVEKEKNDAIKKAKEARERIRDLCNLNPSGCVPDDWFRD